VVHLVGIIRETGRQTFTAVHVEGTTALVQAARHAACRRILYVSAIGADPAAPTAYWRTKAAAEEQVRTSGLGWLILRPSIVFAPDGEFHAVLRRLLAFPVVPVLGPGTSRLAPVRADDLADLEAAAIVRPAAWNRVYAVCGARAFTFDELLRAAARAWNRPCALVHVPLALARPAVALATALLPAPPITSDQLAMLERDSACDPGPAERAFGVRLRSIDGMLAGEGAAR
jgi:NADH dehydrogenase